MAHEPSKPEPRTPFASPGNAGFLARIPRSYLWAGALIFVWLIAVGSYAVGYFGGDRGFSVAGSPQSLEVALFVFAALLPSALLGLGAVAIQKAEEIRLETARLSSAIDALRHSVAPRGAPSANELASALTQATRSAFSEEKAALAEGLSRLGGALAETQDMMNELQQRESKAKKSVKKVASPPVADDAEQPTLPFETENALIAKGAEIPWASVVRALDFPRDERDRDGFDALRLVVADRDFAELMQAAEDTLSILAEEGLYMEDLELSPAPVALWKRYADGARGPEVDQIGGVRDEVAIALARTKYRSDPVFRDTALHFLRRYDKLVIRMFAELGEDRLVLEAGESRTGRAFMMIARVMGVFD